MKINWFGQSCFQIIIKRKKEDPVSIVIDPFDEKTGLKIPSLKADILLITHQHHDHNNVRAISGNPFLISGPGEYEIKDIFVQGIEAFHDKSKGKERGKTTLYTILGEEMTICHLGDFGQNELTNEQIEAMGEIDILMIPVGGIYTISAKEAAKIVSQLEPKIVIPMHYKIPKLKIQLDKLDKFLKVMGVKKPETMKTFSYKKKDLPAEGTKIIILTP